MTTYLGDKAVGVGTVKATVNVGKVITDKKTVLGDGFTEPLAVNTLLFATSEGISASADALRTETDSKIAEVNASIGDVSKAVAQTRNDFEVADQDIRADMSETSSELQTQIISQASEIEKLKQEVAGLSSLSFEILDELPAVGKEGVIYLVPSGGEAPNLRDEYVWVNGAFEVIGSTQVDLTGYVKDTDYASMTKAGLVKLSAGNALTINRLDGSLYADNLALGEYQNMDGLAFVGKGTLENIKDDYVKRGITANAITLTDEEKAAAQAWLGVESGGGDYLPDQTDNAGKFLTTDGTTASWGEALVNKKTEEDNLAILGTITRGTGSVVIGPNAISARGWNTVIGAGARAPGYAGSNSVIIGNNASSIGTQSVVIGTDASNSDTSERVIAIGWAAKANADFAIQLGAAATNSDANTFKVANINGNFEMMDANGNVPLERLTYVTNQIGDISTALTAILGE